MPWECENNCHFEAGEDFQVKRPQLREDMIVHTFGKDDKTLSSSLGFKVYEGSEVSYFSPECSICEGRVNWVEKSDVSQ